MPGTPVSLFIARHGETVDNAGGLILGRRDPPLSPTGREQAAGLAVRAAGLDLLALWCSPLLRARETAEVVAEAIGMGPTILEDLIESDRGSWEGQSVMHLAETSPALHAAFEAGDRRFAFPGGESLLQQIQRTRRALDIVASGSLPALVIAHVGTIRAAMLATGRDVPPEHDIPHAQAIPLAWPLAFDKRSPILGDA